MRRNLAGETILLLGGYQDSRGMPNGRPLGAPREFRDDDIGVRVVEATLSLLRAAFARGATIAMSYEPAVLPLAIAVASEYWRPESAEPRPEEPRQSEEERSEPPRRKRPHRAPVSVIDYSPGEERLAEPDVSYFDEDAPSLVTPFQSASATGYVEVAGNPRDLHPRIGVCIGGSAERVRRTLERFAYDGPVYAIGSTGGAAADRGMFGDLESRDVDENLWGRVRNRDREVFWQESGLEPPERSALEIGQLRHSIYPLLMSLLLDREIR